MKKHVIALPENFTNDVDAESTIDLSFATTSLSLPTGIEFEEEENGGS